MPRMTGDSAVTPERMLGMHPRPSPAYPATLASCVNALLTCQQACTSCADSCLAEDATDLGPCIRRCLDCADLCQATAAILSRQSWLDAFVLRTVLLACSAATAACALECLSKAEDFEHCQLCAEACRACERACLEMTEEHLQ